MRSAAPPPPGFDGALASFDADAADASPLETAAAAAAAAEEEEEEERRSDTSALQCGPGSGGPQTRATAAETASKAARPERAAFW